MKHAFELKKLPRLDEGEIEIIAAWITLGNELVVRAKSSNKNIGCPKTIGILEHIKQNLYYDKNNIYLGIASDIMNRIDEYNLMVKPEKFDYKILWDAEKMIANPHTRLSISALKYISTNIVDEIDVCMRFWLVCSIALDNMSIKKYGNMPESFMWFDAVPNLYGDANLNARIFALNSLLKLGAIYNNKDKIMDYCIKVVEKVSRNCTEIVEKYDKKYRNDWVQFLMDLPTKEKEQIRLSGSRAWLELS
jgi:hypothetical protein